MTESLTDPRAQTSAAFDPALLRPLVLSTPFMVFVVHTLEEMPRFAVNAAVHLGSAAWFGDYSPGMVTAATVALPVTALVFTWIRHHRLLTGAQLAATIAIGTGVAAAIGVLSFG
ncbi:hypothetical protein [Nocardia brevicatena]|uniref:hypothetical protein n=1 Tax=Nocardia brevicatena TaxID=37327 RepID=UPI00031B5563|nr:hypothetical protein [Nocardia brevicatena]